MVSIAPNVLSSKTKILSATVALVTLGFFTVWTVPEASAAGFVWRTPPYSNQYSDPSQTCNTFGDIKHCAYVDKTNGVARVFARDNAPLGWNVVKAEHNLNPPVSNPSLTINQYRNMYYYSTLNGKFKITLDDISESGEMRYGGYTTMLRPADQTWVKSYIFYITKSNAGTYTIPDTTVVFVKGEQAGSYGIGTFFGATASGWVEGGTEGEVDAYTTASGYGFNSVQVALEWCDDGTCP